MIEGPVDVTETSVCFRKNYFQWPEPAILIHSSELCPTGIEPPPQAAWEPLPL